MAWSALFSSMLPAGSAHLQLQNVNASVKPEQRAPISFGICKFGQRLCTLSFMDGCPVPAKRSEAISAAVGRLLLASATDRRSQPFAAESNRLLKRPAGSSKPVASCTKTSKAVEL